MSASVHAPVSSPQRRENLVDLVPAAAATAAGLGVYLGASSTAIKAALASTTAMATVASGFSYWPAIASASLAGAEFMTGLPLTRITYALAAAGVTGLAASYGIKFARAATDLTKRGVNAAKQAAAAVQKAVTGGNPRPVPAFAQVREQYAPA